MSRLIYAEYIKCYSGNTIVFDIYSTKNGVLDYISTVICSVPEINIGNLTKNKERIINKFIETSLRKASNIMLFLNTCKYCTDIYSEYKKIIPATIAYDNNKVLNEEILAIESEIEHTRTKKTMEVS